MTWSESFRKAMAEENVYPRFWFRDIRDFGEVWQREGINLSSRHAPGWVSAIVRGRSSIQHATIQPRTWRRTHGGLRLAVASWFNPANRVTRGTPVELRVSFTDDFSDSEVVWVGFVRNVRMQSPDWVIECIDAPGAFISRWAQSAGELAICNRLAPGTVATADYMTGTVIDVDEGPFGAWERAFNINGSGEGWLLRVTPNNGDVFFIKAGTRSLVSGTVYQYGALTKNFLNTTDADADVGNLVEHFAWADGHATDMIYRMIISTGTSGANGEADVWPKTWALGWPNRLVDTVDIAEMRAVSKPAGVAGWSFYAGARISNMYGFIESAYGAAGFFMGLHEGLVTVRAVRNPLTSTRSNMTITSDDLVDVASWEAWSSDCPLEYYVVGALSQSEVSEFHSEASLDSAPVGVYKEINFPYVVANNTSALRAILERVGDFWTRVPERGELVLRGWRLADVCAGDLVRLQDLGEALQPRHRLSYDTYEDRQVLVVGGGPDWFGATTTIQFLALPQREFSEQQSTDPGQGAGAPGLE